MAPCMDGMWVTGDGSVINHPLVLEDLKYEPGLSFVRRECGTVLSGTLDGSGNNVPTEALRSMIEWERMTQRSKLKLACAVTWKHEMQLAHMASETAMLRQENENLRCLHDQQFQAVQDMLQQLDLVRAESRRFKDSAEVQHAELHRRIGRLHKDMNKRMDTHRSVMLGAICADATNPPTEASYLVRL